MEGWILHVLYTYDFLLEVSLLTNCCMLYAKLKEEYIMELQDSEFVNTAEVMGNIFVQIVIRWLQAEQFYAGGISCWLLYALSILFLACFLYTVSGCLELPCCPAGESCAANAIIAANSLDIMFCRFCYLCSGQLYGPVILMSLVCLNIPGSRNSSDTLANLENPLDS